MITIKFLTNAIKKIKAFRVFPAGKYYITYNMNYYSYLNYEIFLVHMFTFHSSLFIWPDNTAQIENAVVLATTSKNLRLVR